MCVYKFYLIGLVGNIRYKFNLIFLDELPKKEKGKVIMKIFN
jgi:hypothetical protein